MVEVARADPSAQHRSLEAERPDTALEFECAFLRHRHRQRRQRLKACGMAGDRRRKSVVGPPRHVNAFRPEVMQRRRGQRQGPARPGRFHPSRRAGPRRGSSNRPAIWPEWNATLGSTASRPAAFHASRISAVKKCSSTPINVIDHLPGLWIDSVRPVVTTERRAPSRSR